MIETTEKVFTFQPTDTAGKPIGSLVEISYTSDSDLQQKMIAACQRMKFVVSRDKTKAPESAPRFEGDGPEADQIRSAVATFLRETPAYVNLDSNRQAIFDWIDQNSLSPVLDNFRLAYRTLSAKPTSSADKTGISYTDPRSGRTYYGKQAIDHMPSDEYRRRFNAESGFADRVERVLANK